MEMSLRRPIPVPVGRTVSVSPSVPGQIRQGGQCLSTTGASRSSRAVMTKCSEFDRWAVVAENTHAANGAISIELRPIFDCFTTVL